MEAASQRPEPERLPGALKQDVEELLAQRFGARFDLLEYRGLARRVSRVGRIAAAPRGGGLARSFIVKHVPEHAYGAPAAWSREFREEAAAYELFSILEPPFLERPERLGFHPSGLLLLEDLGPTLNQRPVEADLSGAFATLFARLHAATAGQKRAHDEARARFGLTPGAPDERQDGVENRGRQFEAGAHVLAEWCALLGLCPGAALLELLAEARRGVETPGPLHAVTHDDLAHGRQCAFRDGRMLMFDFEHARYGFALLDLAKALVGKFERHHPTRVMVLSWPGMERALAIRYRQELARAGGPELSDGAWDAALADAMVFTTVCQLGVLRFIIDRGQVQGTLLPNMRKLLRRMEAVLEGNAARREVRALLSALDQRIAFA